MKRFRINLKKDPLGVGSLERRGNYLAWLDMGTEQEKPDYVMILHTNTRDIIKHRRIDVERIKRRARKAGVSTAGWGMSGQPIKQGE